MSSTIRILGSRIRKNIQKKAFSRKQDVYMKDFGFSEAAKVFPSRNDLYAYMHH